MDCDNDEILNGGFHEKPPFKTENKVYLVILVLILRKFSLSYLRAVFRLYWAHLKAKF